ncbi:MAG: phosphatidyl-myo-inositol dimannoside synthase [Actinomycetota bacterium]|jgi:phosphatidylinositol alpha-1,6-mannosyltransferase|nr:phosphatidyl-myo-inositol dimannoside synthase [Actinomycetota bacterium]
MPRALLVTTSFLPGRGGIESYLAELCLELAPDLAVLAPAQRDGKPIPSDLPYRTFPYSSQTVVPGPALVRAIDSAARELEVDRILFGTPWPLSLIAARVAALGYPYGFIVYGAELLVPTAAPGLRGLMLDVLAGSDFVLSCSNYTLDRLGSMLEARGRAMPQHERLPARVDMERFNPDVDTSAIRLQLGLVPEDRVVLSFGRLVERKGVHRMIDVMAQVNERVPEAVFVVAGGGPEERNLRRQAEVSAGRVVFAGRVSEADAPALFATADVFTLPVVDRYFGLEVEGLGVVMLEAGACGTPSVIGRSGGSPETVVDGETGFVIDARDRGVLADRVGYLLERPDEAAEMGRKARGFVEREFATAPLPPPLLSWLGEGP